MQRHGQYRSSHGKKRATSPLAKAIRVLTKGSLLKNVLLACVALGLLGVLVLFIGYLWLSSTLPNAEDINNRDVAQSTKIYDRTGEHLLYEIAENEKRTIVSIDAIPQDLINATITAEDRHFYTHGGISYRGIARSIYEDIKCGCKAQGASTLTQQMVRNVILTLDKSFTRKFKEILLAFAVEEKFTKDEILSLYLNQIGYGSTNYGVESASQAYFGKSVSDISLAEAATLAAMPKQPSRYLRDPELLKGRRDWILTSMEELGYATHDQVVAALAEETPVVAHLNDIIAPHFVLWVKEQLENEYTEREVETGGLKVITTLDYDKQMHAEAAITTGVETKGDAYGFNNASLLSIDPKTGQILAMVGSVDYNNDEIHGQVNVTQQALQPGSSMKPIIYAAAWEGGYTPNTVLWDVDTVFPTDTGPYQPRNYDNSEHGYVTMRKALQGSLNIPAVKTMALIGVDRAITFAQHMGYTTLEDRSRFGLSLVLGGAEVTMMDHVRAYGTFAYNGLQQDTVGILKVTDPNGTILSEWKESDHKGKRVLEENTSAIVSNVLSDNNARAYVFGTSSALQLGARPVAAKTGTTNDFNDAWTVGYTPSIATAVWVGNTDGTKMYNNAESIFVAAPIWKEFMQNALEGSPIENFPTPSIATTGKAMLDGSIPTTTYTIDSSSGLLATEFTPEQFVKTETCGEYHTLLTYVNTADPRGDIPEDPSKNPFYQSWESGVQQWIEKHNTNLKDGEAPITTCNDIPTEYDTTHTQNTVPEISFRSPNQNQNIDRTFQTELSSAVHGTFDRVEYFIDGAFVTSSTNMDGTSLSLPNWVTRGKHTLSARIFDTDGNNAEASVSVSVSVGPETTATFHITNPFPHQNIERSDAPYAVIIEVPNVEDISYIEVTAKNLWTGTTTVIGSTSSPSSITSIPWTITENAKYQIIARASTHEGLTQESIPIVVTAKSPKPSSIPL